MSRIHDILKKAERDGGMHRTRDIDADGASTATAVAEPPAMPIAPPPPHRASHCRRDAGERPGGSFA